MYLSALGQPILILNSLKAAAELLDRRASIYSDRPRLIMSQEILSGSLVFAFNHVDESVSCFPRTNRSVLTAFLVATGAVAVVLLTRALQNQQFVIITIFYVKKGYFLLLLCWPILVI